MRIFVTGAAGYIGSHAVLQLLEAGHTVTGVDNFARGHMEAIDAIRKAFPDADFHFTRLNIGNTQTLAGLMRERRIDLVMHFAALAYVGESVDEPLSYYRNNTAGALSVLEAMHLAEVHRLVFSSTCATYGEPEATSIPIAETCPQMPVNPYGRSKLFVEHMIRDHAAACTRAGIDFRATMLRYFNVAGSDPSGRIGEDHRPETHLIPIALEAALGQRPYLIIHGTNYATPDGTCIRDYVHVTDLIEAHITAMDAMNEKSAGAVDAFNVGIGRGYSVREVIETAQRVTGVKFAIQEGPRRAGDPPRLFADPTKIHRELGWRARFTDLGEMIETACRWKQSNPHGYQ